jgi:hypothetical protein
MTGLDAIPPSVWAEFSSLTEMSEEELKQTIMIGA